jgi:hydroxypyruvate isomerase
VAEAGYKILFALAEIENKTDEEGWNNCVLGLQNNSVEKHNVIFVMELLNSKLTIQIINVTKPPGVELAKRLIENFKLLLRYLSYAN